MSPRQQRPGCSSVQRLWCTDTPNPFVVPGYSVHKELKYFVNAGLTPYEAIKAATRDAAEFVDALDEWGTLAVGRRADLILVSGNPLKNVSNTTKLAGVILRGQWHPQSELQEKLDKLASEYEASEVKTEEPK